MKQFLYLLICMLILPCMNAKASSDRTGQNKSEVPAMYLDGIEKADSLTFLIIDPWSESTDNWMDGYGEVLASKVFSCECMKKLVADTFSNPDAFVKSDIVKNCTFMPDYAIVCHSKKGDVIVAYSFYCDTCRFSKGDKYIDLDGERVRNGFLDIISKAFPNDRYVRYLIKKSKSNF